MGDLIRNFCIVAHIDHGKSTLADRLLEMTGTVSKDKLKPQLLDSLALERERGITIKLAPVRMHYTFNSQLYTLNLIDTPGHVDFSYEVSRSLAAVEGAILLVDGTSGIQAQTLSHGLSAIEQKLTLIPVINKIDLAGANIDKTKKEIVDTFGFDQKDILLVSAKTGEGVAELLQAIIEKIPKPVSNIEKPLRALIFDSFFDIYKGIIAQIKVVDGKIPPIGTKIHFLATGGQGTVSEIGFFAPELTQTPDLVSGEIGYIATGIKTPNQVQVGDTITTEQNAQALPGYKKSVPMVYVGLYPIDPRDLASLKEALAKFKLIDPAFEFSPEKSIALGGGFRCGFLGLLHAEIVQERLTREFSVDLMSTMPSVEYLVDGKVVNNPADFEINANLVKEPWAKLKIFTASLHIGGISSLIEDKRGEFVNMEYFGNNVEIIANIPLPEMLTDFYDKLKSISSGFATLDWQFLEYRQADVVRIDILVGGTKVDALSTITVQEKAQSLGRKLVSKLKEVLPRQQFEIAIQAAVGAKVIARETISAYRKDVTSKLYGGDRTRKDKLLDKQKKGKKKMKMVGRVEIPQEAFLAVLKM